jgi:Protein of unknown function (DUF1453)
MAHHPYFWLALAPLLYVRIRRSLGFRKFSGLRLLIPIALFLGLMALTFVANAHHTLGWTSASLGAIAGGVLGFLAIRKTEFQTREDGLYYRTHIWIQVTVLGLFLMRMTYRFYEVFVAARSGASPSPMQAFQDPLTAGTVCMLLAYNLVYFGFVLRTGGRLASLVAPQNPV